MPTWYQERKRKTTALPERSTPRRQTARPSRRTSPWRPVCGTVGPMPNRARAPGCFRQRKRDAPRIFRQNGFVLENRYIGVGTQAHVHAGFFPGFSENCFCAVPHMRRETTPRVFLIWQRLLKTAPAIYSRRHEDSDAPRSATIVLDRFLQPRWPSVSSRAFMNADERVVARGTKD